MGTRRRAADISPDMGSDDPGRVSHVRARALHAGGAQKPALGERVGREGFSSRSTQSLGKGLAMINFFRVMFRNSNVNQWAVACAVLTLCYFALGVVVVQYPQFKHVAQEYWPLLFAPGALAWWMSAYKTLRR